jgi:type I restriction enzyme S subunit
MHAFAIPQLPAGWKLLPFEQCCERVADNLPASACNGKKYIGLEHLQAGFPALVGVGNGADIVSAKTAFRIGDVLFGKLRPYLRKGVRVFFDGVCSTDIFAFRPRACVTSDFLGYLIHTDPFAGQAIRTTSGVNHPRTSWDGLRKFGVPVPPRDEQRKIAAVLSAVQRAIERQERLISLTAELKKALMHKLFTEGTRGEPQKQTEIGPIPKSWDLLPCSQLCPTISVGVVVRPRSYYVENGVPAFRSLNVREDQLQADDLVHFSREINNGELSKSKLRAGDVLVVRTGYPGTSCVVPEEFDGANCVDIIFMRAGPSIISPFLSRFLNSYSGKQQATTSSHGLAQQHLNVGAVKRVLVPLPSLNEQQKIVDALSAADSKRRLHAQSREVLTQLFRNLLHQLMTAQIRVDDLDLSALDELSAIEQPAGAA